MRRVHAMPFGSEITDEGVRFALWAPTAKSVSLLLDGAEHPMPDLGGGWRRLSVPEARAGQRYAFRIDGGLVVPDPAARFQPEDVHRASELIDPRAYAWSDEAWGGRPWEETVLYELHVGTATREGTFAALMTKLEVLKEVGITAIELMPIAEFPGRRNWGYDGVLPFAPDAAYGAPDDLKRLVDRAHALGLMMFLDVVYNHFGPAGNYLGAYANSFLTDRYQTPWGAGINVDGTDTQPVRDFIVHNALYWLEEYHFDGLRLDAVHAIRDESERHVLAEIAERVRATLPGRPCPLVLENDLNEARWLARDAGDRPRFYTAQWDDDLHHCWHTLLTGEADGYYADYADDPVGRLGRCLAEGFAFQGEPSRYRRHQSRGEKSAHLPPSAFVAFLQNHDQIGNRAFGERLTELTPPEKLDLARAALLLLPQIPMLFMGEEWGAPTPFLYFVDFSDDPVLENAVREGRQREFTNFKSFRDRPGHRDIPDPTLEDTFVRSRLDWTQPNDDHHRAMLDDTRRFLALRRSDVIPILQSRYLGAEHNVSPGHALDVTWRFAGGTLRFCANFGASQADVAADENWRTLWASAAVKAEAARIRMPSWCGIVQRGEAR
jgi:maltooligosyltrehalose trehalohydrolase